MIGLLNTNVEYNFRIRKLEEYLFDTKFILLILVKVLVMKILISSLFVGCLLIAGVAVAERPARAKAVAGCSSVVNLPNGAFIYKNSAPLRKGGVGTPLVGYRIEPSLIMMRNFGRGTGTIISTKGTRLGSCPWASAHDAAGGRLRCTMNTRSLRSAAVRAGGKPSAYFRTSGGTCALVPDIGRCYGSVKGLCNRLLS